MAYNYRPYKPFTYAMELLIPTVSKKNGVAVKSYPDSGEVINCSFKSYGGTETIVNGVLSIIDTATVETWYRPDITSLCRLKRQDGRIYEIINEPENIDLRNQFLKIKVKCVKGGV